MGSGVSRVKSVEKATVILNSFSPRAQVLSVRALAESTGYPRATVHALCITLCDAGLLQSIPGRGYALGVGLVALAGQVLHRQSIIEAGEGLLQTLAYRDGTWVLVGQLVEGWVVYLARYTSAHHGRLIHGRACALPPIALPAARLPCPSSTHTMPTGACGWRARGKGRICLTCANWRLNSPRPGGPVSW